MPNRRRTARKLKRAINKAKINAKRTQQPEKKQEDKKPDADLLKLMALLGNKGQQSLDPATFLRLKEEAVARDNEIRKTKLETKEVESKNAAAKQEHDLALAKKALEDATRKAQLTQEMLKAQGELAGVEGEIRDYTIQQEQAQHRIDMNKKDGDLEAAIAKRDALKNNVRMLTSSINHNLKGRVHPGTMELIDSSNELLERFGAALEELNKRLIL